MLQHAAAAATAAAAAATLKQVSLLGSNIAATQAEILLLLLCIICCCASPGAELVPPASPLGAGDRPQQSPLPAQRAPCAAATDLQYQLQCSNTTTIPPATARLVHLSVRLCWLHILHFTSVFFFAMLCYECVFFAMVSASINFHCCTAGPFLRQLTQWNEPFPGQPCVKRSMSLADDWRKLWQSQTAEQGLHSCCVYLMLMLLWWWLSATAGRGSADGAFHKQQIKQHQPLERRSSGTVRDRGEKRETAWCLLAVQVGPACASSGT